MKAIFIDAEKHEIREVEYSQKGENDLPTLQNLLDGWIDLAFRFPNGDVLFVDEEGYLKPTMNFFCCSFRTDQPMAGNGVIVGREVEDEDESYHTLDPTTSIEWLQSNIAWMTRAGFDRWAKENRDRPAGTITVMGENGKAETSPLYTYGDLHRGMGRKDDDPES